MIYVMSQKFLSKYDVKMVKQNEYFILDGENYAVTGRSVNKVAVATKYNRSHSVGGFCPENRLYTMISKKKRGEEINKEKYKKEVKKFIKDKALTAAISTAFKALNATGYDQPLNIFIVLPNRVYDALSKKIIKRMEKLANVDFKFIFTQEDIKDDFKRLKKNLNRDQLKTIEKSTKRIEKKYKLKYMVDDDED